ncbi:MAG: flap endonuclease [Thermoleophilia bacterium]|nr:flap endonuclease [Thermoleophilia bacterium]
MIVHLIDGTYELFRQYYGLRRGRRRDDLAGRTSAARGPAPPGRGPAATQSAAGAPAAANPRGAAAPAADSGAATDSGAAVDLDAVRAVLRFVLRMLEGGATHLGVATDHVIESFRNDLWPGYKTSAGMERDILAQFEPLEEALVAMGVAVWAMVELEADDALAAAARLAAADPRVETVSIWTPDKDLAQCVRGDRVVQVDSRTGTIRDQTAVRRKFGVEPALIPDYLALVGDAADGYPGIRGIGPKTAAGLLNRHGPIEAFPSDALGEQRGLALLFKDLATLRADEQLFSDVDELEWRGPTAGLEAWAERIGDPGLEERCRALHRSAGR